MILRYKFGLLCELPRGIRRREKVEVSISMEIDIPMKIGNLLWLSLRNKILTWDNL
jgi:hypothetical protein